MIWKPDTLSDIPVFRQIYQHYEELILRGGLLPGSKLPPERELASRLCVNRSTVSAAYEELRATGLVSSVQGSGTRVSESLWEETPSRTPNWQRYTTQRSFDPTSALQKKLLAAFAHPGFINMTRGELSPDLMPQSFLGELAADIDFSRPFSYYQDFKGDPRLRDAVARFVKNTMQWNADPHSILITAGVKHSLHLISSTLLQPGDAVAVEGPSYLYGMQVFTPSGLRMVKLPVDEQGVVPERLTELYHKHRVRMVFINPTFQNPTGTTLPLERRLKLLAICEQLRLPIVEDDPYGLISLDAAPPIPPLKALSGGERFVIYTGTLSKIATPGMRIGWIMAPAPVIEQLAQAKNRMGYSASHTGERLAASYLESPASLDLLTRIRDSLQQRRARMLEALREHVGDEATLFAPKSPAGGFYLWLKLKYPITDYEMVEAGVQEGVLISPGNLYGAAKGYVRLTYASVSEDQIAEGIRRLGKALRRI